MNNYILLSKSYGYLSMKSVVSLMNNKCDLITKNYDGKWQLTENNTVTTLKSNTIKQLLKTNNIINWGNYIFDDDNLFDLNKSSCIKLAANKKECRKILQENKIAVPETWFNLDDIKFPVIARPYTHHKGQFFIIIDNIEDCCKFYKYIITTKYNNLSDWYFSKLFNKTNEYRVYCAHGKILAINEKPLNENEIRANQAITHNPWNYVKWNDYNYKICLESLKAISCIGLDYGAVDIMYNKDNNECAICEINTSPPTIVDSQS